MLRARWMTRRDHRQVGKILDSYDSGQTITDIRGKLSKNVVGMVAADQEIVEGFMLYSLLPEDGRLKVMDFAVADKHCWDEVSIVLLEALVKKLCKRYTHCEIDVSLDYASYFSALGWYAVAEDDDVIRMQTWVDGRIPRFKTKYSRVV